MNGRKNCVYERGNEYSYEKENIKEISMLKKKYEERERVRKESSGRNDRDKDEKGKRNR